MLSRADVIWNRACMSWSQPSEAYAGDRALARMLGLHSVVSNGGVLHGVQLLLDEGELEEACAGYEYYGINSAVSLIRRAVCLLSEGTTDEIEEAEPELDHAYALEAGDSLLEEAFKRHLAQHPEEYAPAANEDGN